MAGTKEGGLKTAATVKALYGEKYYENMGAIGGKNGSAGKGFAANRELAAEVGAKGGRTSRRKKNA